MITVLFDVEKLDTGMMIYCLTAVQVRDLLECPLSAISYGIGLSKNGYRIAGVYI